MISVIIPMYQIEKYVSKCIESVLKQTYQNIEIILVDDGSTDNTLSICECYAKKDYRIKVYSKTNGGVSSARNLGLEKAQGEYVFFLDGDDEIKSNYLESLYLYAKENQVDIVKTRITRKNQSDIDYDAILDQQQMLNLFLDDYEFNSCCGELIKLKLLTDNKIKFDETITYGEDLLFNLMLSDYCQKVGYLKEVFYYYRENQNSLTRTINYNHIYRKCFEIILVYSTMYKRKVSINKINYRIYSALNYNFKLLIYHHYSYREIKKLMVDVLNNQRIEKITTKLRFSKLEITLLLLRKKHYFSYYLLVRFYSLFRNNGK